MNTHKKKKSMSFIGRTEEIDILEQMYVSKKPEFLALYGRRRVGKTFLIRKFFEDKKGVFLNVTGTKKGTFAEQIRHFSDQISRTFYNDATLAVPKNWDEAFNLLTNAIRGTKAKKVILFFDEIPWMATRKSRLLQNLDYYWNQHWSNDARVKLIICGSSASWVVNKIINNKGGLHNRITRRIRLEPFNLQETKAYLNSLGIQLKNQQILLLYMVTGGVAYYLSSMKKGLSAAQIIEKTIFNEKGMLFNEFDNLFSSLFDHSDVCIQIVQALGKHQYGLGKRELLKSLGKSSMGGSGLKKLEELEEAGFIMSFTPHYHKRQGIYYRLIDEYVLFYLKWVVPIKKSLQKKSLEKGNWQSMQQTPVWYSWLGYAFESVCYKHISAIRGALSIPPDAIASAWRYVPRKGNLAQGAQIDLLFDRNDDVITICEIKYTEEPFVLTKGYVVALKQKLAVFKERTRTKKQLFLAIISANGIKNNFYAEDNISGIVVLDDLFKQ
jgi:uncharacterized protein